MEQWTCLEEFGFPNYSISDLGRVRNDRTDRLLAISVNQNGSAKVGMIRSGGRTQHTIGVAPMVAMAFLERHPNSNFDTPINLNGDRLDNEVSNLMWRPRWFAIRYHRQFKDPHWDRNRWPVQNLYTGEVFSCAHEAAMRDGLLVRDIFASFTADERVFPDGHVFRQYR